MTCMTNRTVTISAFIICTLVTVIGSNQALATHIDGVADFEWHIWSRNSSDGHLSYLNCSNDYCALKIKTISGIQSLSQSTIDLEVDSIEADFDGLGKKMTIDRVTVASDSVITEANLPTTYSGYTDYDLHCTSWFLIWCTGADSHFTKMTVQLNDNSHEYDFQLTENEANNEYDVRKTLGHELFHAMGIDHNSGSDSIVYYSYVFGESNGYVANAADKADLEARYP